MNKADGSIIIDTKFDVSGLESNDIKRSLEDIAGSAEKFRTALNNATEGGEKLGDTLEDVEDQLKEVKTEAENTGENVDGLFDSMFSANAAADIVSGALQEIGNAMKDFLVGSVETAADLQAENAQFEQTFLDLEETATKSLNAIEKQTGITASRMKTSYTKTFAFTKSIGADSEQAMDIANRAMLAAADSAAYYDKTVEEATETLQSFLKGNFENDAALGIAATETTRNAKANELYAKSFNDLTEAQKVDVLLAMVEAGNEASGALGQAAREADSWTNVTGELNEAWRKLQGVLGGPILAGVIPVIKGITSALNDMIESSTADELKRNMDDIVDSWEDAEEAFSGTSEEIRATNALAKSYVKQLKALEKEGVNNTKTQKEYRGVVDALNKLMPELNLQIDEQTGLLDQNAESVLKSVEALKERALYEANYEKLTQALKTQADAVILVEDAERELFLLQQEHIALTEQLGGTTDEYTQRLEEARRQLEFQMATTGSSIPITKEALYAMAGLTDEEIKWYEALLDNEKAQATLNQIIAEGKRVIAEQDERIEELNAALGDYSDGSEDAAKKGAKFKANVSDVLAEIKSLRDAYIVAKEACRESLDSQIGYFEELKEKSSMSTKEIIENWKKQTEAFANYERNLEKAVELGLDETLVKQLADGSNESMLILHGLVNQTGISVEEINKAFRDNLNARDSVSVAMEEVQYGILGKIDEIVNDVDLLAPLIGKKLAEKIAGQRGAVIAAMQAIANAGLDAFEDTLAGRPVKGTSAGKNFEVSLASEMAPYTLSAAADIPYLASGAVIPPNAPFAAVLGDQSNGRNLEAPEGLIRQIFQEEFGNMLSGIMAGFEAVTARQDNIADIVNGISIGDDVIGQASNRYQQKMQTVHGGW